MKGYNGIYLMGNHPDVGRFKEAASIALERFDFLEVGVPFSDPVADVPVIASAGEEVLARGFWLKELFRSIGDIMGKAHSDKKIYMMSYANPVHNLGLMRFARESRRAGISGLILPDVPFVESWPFRDALAMEKLEYIDFLTPENTHGQIEATARAARGFLYFVSIRGITGADFKLDAATRVKIRRARRSSRVPVVLGFGVRNAADARAAVELAGGFIVGTGAVAALADGGPKGFEHYIDSLFD